MLNNKMLKIINQSINAFYYLDDNLKRQELNNCTDNISVIINKSINSFRGSNNRLDKQNLVDLFNNNLIGDNDYIYDDNIMSDERNITCDIINTIHDINTIIGKQGSIYHYNYMDGPCFNLNELLYSVYTHLMLVNTLTFKTENNALNIIIDKLLKTNNVDYFKSGYNYDLLVHDRVGIINHENINYLLIDKNYLSTYTVNDYIIDKYYNHYVCNGDGSLRYNIDSYYLFDINTGKLL